MLTHPVEI